MSETTGQKVKRLRESKGLTQAQLGTLADMDHTAVSRLEHDRMQPRKRTLRDVARALNVKPELLMPDVESGGE